MRYVEKTEVVRAYRLVASDGIVATEPARVVERPERAQMAPRPLRSTPRGWRSEGSTNGEVRMVTRGLAGEPHPAARKEGYGPRLARRRLLSSLC